ncbi:MAG: type II secretion system F family protein [Eubacterium sp.]|nr:type II secretion system F family protein [Eubacterium sp.]
MSKKVLSNEYISAFCLEMSLLLHSGIGTEDGLYLLADDEPSPSNQKMLKKMAEVVSEGRPFSEAIREASCFPKYVADMIDTGEMTGRLEQSFRALADYYDRQVQISAQIRSAILYPVILLILMLVIIVVLLVRVLPIFNNVYEQLGGTMSGTAKALLSLGNVLGNIMPVLCVILGVIVVFIAVISGSRVYRGAVLSFYKKIFGSIGLSRRMAESRFASAMAMGMASGLNIEDSFRSAMRFQDTTPKVAERYGRCLERLERGEPLAESFREERILDAAYCRILDLGAKSGTSDDAMAEIARRMDDAVQMDIERKVGKIEPTIVIITSVLVGIILIAVMLPLINIMSSIG